jgi:hypothetical protein
LATNAICWLTGGSEGRGGLFNRPWQRPWKRDEPDYGRTDDNGDDRRDASGSASVYGVASKMMTNDRITAAENSSSGVDRRNLIAAIFHRANRSAISPRSGGRAHDQFVAISTSVGLACVPDARKRLTGRK